MLNDIQGASVDHEQSSYSDFLMADSYDESESPSIGTYECRAWSNKLFLKHKKIDGYLKSNYKKVTRNSGYISANNSLRELNKELTIKDHSYSYNSFIYVGNSFSCAIDSDDIEVLAALRSKACEDIYREALSNTDVVGAVHIIRQFVDFSFSVSFPLSISKNDAYEAITKKSLGAVARVSDAKWWRRQIRKCATRQLENILRRLGFTRREKSPYVSKYVFGQWKVRQRKNKELLDGLVAVNELGESVALSECVAKSVSNPEIMRTELMTRMGGYEEVAKGIGLDAILLTLTSPSSFHAQLEAGRINTKYSGATPTETMNYLNDVWARIRASWARSGIKVFGFRVAEPHHDGTPHFHFLLFIRADEKKMAKDIFGRYALALDGDEKGADKHRWDCVDIDPSKGSAAGYIAKYVSKNMDGHQLEFDEEAQTSAQEGAMRARAWASTWGIRQFQQIGSVSVTVWRELRRVRAISDEVPEALKALHSAADRGDWKEFVELMGGAFVARDDQTVRPEYIETDALSGEYGDDVCRLIGVWLRPVANALGRFLSTREHVWKIQPMALSVGILEEAKRPPLDLCQ
jgi:hypothetical protein